jgi:hypothetical protein
MRFASRWQLPGPSTGSGVCRETRTDTYSKNGKVFSGAPDARVRGTDRTIAHRHGSDRQRFFSQELDEQLCCREHDPRHEQGRACKQQKIVEDSGHHIPHAHGPMQCRRARAGRRRDGDTSNLAQNARRFDWFPRPTLFWCLKFSFCSHGGAMKVVGIVPLGGAGEVVEVDETKIGKVDGATRCAHSGLMPCSKPHSYSITLSARASNSGEMLRPSALAALRLMTRSNLVGCCIGSSPGLAPWRILST